MLAYQQLSIRSGRLHEDHPTALAADKERPAHRPAREIDHVAQEPPRTHRSGDNRGRHATRNGSLGLVSRLASLALFLARELSLASALCLAPALCLASPLAARLIRRGNIAPARRHLPAGAITAS